MDIYKYKVRIGAGFFAIMNEVLNFLAECSKHNYEYIIDFDDEIFPYNNKMFPNRPGRIDRSQEKIEKVVYFYF